MAKSIKDRTFYVLQAFDEGGKTSLIGVWDNPSLAERELKAVARAENDGTLEIERGEKSLTIRGLKSTFVMTPIKMNVNLR